MGKWVNEINCDSWLVRVEVESPGFKEFDQLTKIYFYFPIIGLNSALGLL